MLKLEDITPHAAITGIEPGRVVRVVTTEPVGDNALTVYYKTSDGRLLERMLFRTDERLFEKSSIGGTSSVHWRDDCQTIPYRPY